MMHVGHIIPVSIPGGVQFRGGTQITKDNILHGTHDIPHVYHEFPHGTEHPHSTQDISPRY